MARYYLDTSALLPYYREEKNSDKVQKFLQSISHIPVISSLTKTEFASALARWLRMKELEIADAERIRQIFNQHLELNLYQVRIMNDSHFAMAERWLHQGIGALRTLDALHLAHARQLDLALVTCDKALADAADQLGIDNLLIS